MYCHWSIQRFYVAILCVYILSEYIVNEETYFVGNYTFAFYIYNFKLEDSLFVSADYFLQNLR